MFELLRRNLEELAPVIDAANGSLEIDQARIFLPEEYQVDVPPEMEHAFDMLVWGKDNRKYEWLIEQDFWNGCLTINLEQLDARELSCLLESVKEFSLDIDTFNGRMEGQCGTCEHCPDEWDPSDPETWCACEHIDGYTPNCPFYEQ